MRCQRRKLKASSAVPLSSIREKRPIKMGLGDLFWKCRPNAALRG